MRAAAREGVRGRAVRWTWLHCRKAEARGSVNYGCAARLGGVMLELNAMLGVGQAQCWKADLIIQRIQRIKNLGQLNTAAETNGSIRSAPIFLQLA